MYMEMSLPIHIVLGLKEEVAVSRIGVESKEMYSSILKHFTVEGSFTFPTKNWTHLGNFKAKNNFEEQYFNLNKKVVRYIKLTITSTYGSWMYFTLTQVKIFGEGIFADAVKEVGTSSGASKTTKPFTSALVDYTKEKDFMSGILLQPKKDVEEKDVCPNSIAEIFKTEIKQVHQNLIVDLLSKVSTL